MWTVIRIKHRMLEIPAHKEETESNGTGREIEVRVGSWTPKEDSISQRQN